MKEGRVRLLLIHDRNIAFDSCMPIATTTVGQVRKVVAPWAFPRQVLTELRFEGQTLQPYQDTVPIRELQRGTCVTLHAVLGAKRVADWIGVRVRVFKTTDVLPYAEYNAVTATQQDVVDAVAAKAGHRNFTLHHECVTDGVAMTAACPDNTTLLRNIPTVSEDIGFMQRRILIDYDMHLELPNVMQVVHEVHTRLMQLTSL